MRKVFLLLLPVCLIAVAACQDEDYVYPSVVTEFIDGQTDETGTLSQQEKSIPYSRAKDWTG